MILAFQIAWRNVLRNFWRSIITVTSISLGIFVLLLLWAMNDGQYNSAIYNFPLRYIGSIQVHKDGFFNQPKLENHIPNPQIIISSLEKLKLNTWSVRLNSFALAAGDETSTGVNLVGIDPIKERNVSTLDDRIIEGRFLMPSDQYVAILGSDISKKLKAELGSEIVLLTNDRRGAMTADRFKVVGLVKTGDPNVDERSVFIPLIDSQVMLAMEGRITDVVIQVPESELIEKVNELENLLQTEGFEVMPWFEISSLIKDAQTLDAAFAWIFVSIVTIIVISGVVNAVLISMMQRTKEFGVMLALGSKRIKLGMMIAFETLILGVGGTLLGTFTGLLFVEWLSGVGLDLSKLIEGDGLEKMLDEFGIDPVIYPTVNTDHLIITVSVMLLASVLSSIYPVWRAIRLEPIEAIRHA